MHLSDVLSALESIVGLKGASPLEVVEEVAKLASRVVDSLESAKAPASEPVAVPVVPHAPAVEADKPSAPEA